MSKIILEDVKIYAFHGVLPEERILGTYYIINAEIKTDLWMAAETDDLNDTINYAEINEIIHQQMAIPSDLLEHVAGRVISEIHKKFSQVAEISIRITKTRPPMKGEMKGVSIELNKKFKN
jgi:dihydroneopterin aldolase